MSCAHDANIRTHPVTMGLRFWHWMSPTAGALNCFRADGGSAQPGGVLPGRAKAEGPEAGTPSRTSPPLCSAFGVTHEGGGRWPMILPVCAVSEVGRRQALSVAQRRSMMRNQSRLANLITVVLCRFRMCHEALHEFTLRRVLCALVLFQQYDFKGITMGLFVMAPMLHVLVPVSRGLFTVIIGRAGDLGIAGIKGGLRRRLK